MNNAMKIKISKWLPSRLKAIWEVYLKGEIGEYAKGDKFLYDRGAINLLPLNSFSQFGQDAFIYWIVCAGGERTNSETGFFLDIGGNDPVKINNSYFFEQKGWSGMAFEPIKALADKWADARKTPCYNIAIGMTEDEVEFTEVDAHEHSGIGAAADPGKSTTYKVKQRKLANILKENNIKHVDVVSIDVEGYEMNVLKGIDFEAVDITCFCIENNRDGVLLPDMELRKFMVKKGYRLIARLSIDDIFVKEDYLVKKA